MSEKLTPTLDKLNANDLKELRETGIIENAEDLKHPRSLVETKKDINDL